MKTKKGFTLIEVLISLAILAIVSASVLPVVAWLINRTHKYQYDSKAAAVLLEGVEASYNVLLAKSENGESWDEFSSGQRYKPTFNATTKGWDLTNGQSVEETRFTRWIEFSDVCREPGSGKRDENCLAGSEKDNKSKTIKAYVTWSESSGDKSIKAELLVTNL